MQKKTNDVTLFSNGIGHFRRVYTIPSGKEEAISIPFKSDCIGDVAASLQVFGKVRFNTPPSFTPANSHATSLHIDQSEALKSLLRQLSGSLVSITRRNVSPTQYTLLGMDSESTVLDGAEVSKNFVVAMRNGAVCRLSLDEVTDIQFEDASVRTEIEKALKSNFQQIKPDSTLLDLSLSALEGESVEAIVQYTIPVAAWKMRYAIREEKGKFSLEGAAIIDNNTDEDWINFRVSVVTGNPISFNTDIANVVVPQRKMVHLVDRLTMGNVDVEEGMVMMAACAPAPTRSLRAKSLGAKMSTANYASFGLEVSDDERGGMENDSYVAAEAPGVESKDVGDFCVFTSKEPITILARKSAVVPMFTKPLDQAGVVLLYKETNNARRPYRSIKFKNETEYTLGRGKTVIYNEGLFSGECVLETSKPGENRMLPHCLENGVKIVKENKGYETRRSSLKISDGVGVTEDVQMARTAYAIENKKDEPFKVALEHTNTLGQPNALADFEGVEIKEKEKLVDSNGWRVYFELKPKESRTLTVTETYVNQQSVLLNGNFHWIRSNVIDLDNPLATNKQIQACIKVQSEIDDVQEKQQEAAARRQELTQQITRVRENLSATKEVTTSQTVDKWVTDLDLSEQEIREIDKTTIPKLNKQRKELAAKLAEELKKITASWKDK